MNSMSYVISDGVWKVVPKRPPKGPCPSRIFEIESEPEDNQSKETELEAGALKVSKYSFQ